MSLYYYLNQDAEIDEKFCFVVMPFHSDMKQVYDDAIAPAVEEAGLECARADKNVTSTNIMLQILNDILRARLVIVEVTGFNPNVLYELGICQAVKPDVIVIKHISEDSLPIDVSQMRYLEYEDLGDLRTKLVAAIKSLSLISSGGVAYPALSKALTKAIRHWKSGRHHSISIEQFVDMVMSLESLKPSDDGMAVLSHCSAHYGQKMRYLSELCKNNETAIVSLVEEAASNTTTRVPWRAAVMLEHCSPALVKKHVLTFKGSIVNEEIFPDPILNCQTRQVLGNILDDPDCPEWKQVKLDEVRRQLQAEFGDG